MAQIVEELNSKHEAAIAQFEQEIQFLKSELGHLKSIVEGVMSLADPVHATLDKTGSKNR